MGNFSQKMATCPLKQYVREELWEKYVAMLSKKPITYLTLYCSSIMDVKHLYQKNYIAFRDGVYKGVVGVTDESGKGYSQTISAGEGRLEYLFESSIINKLIKEKKKKFTKRFAFDVINLDYCDYIYGSDDDASYQYISGNMKDVISIIDLQRKSDCNKFVLFVTTRTDSSRGSGFANKFKNELQKRIEMNIQANREFEEKFSLLFSSLSYTEIRSTRLDEFLSIGIVKLIAQYLAQTGYSVLNCDLLWLLRDRQEYPGSFLHIALLIGDGTPIKLRPRQLPDVGRPTYLDKGVTVVLDKFIDGAVKTIKVSKDYAKLQRKYKSYLETLSKNFEIEIPKPNG